MTKSTMKLLLLPRWYTTLHPYPDSKRRNKSHLLKAMDKSGISTQSNGVYVPTGITACGKKVYQSLRKSNGVDTRCKSCDQLVNIKFKYLMHP